MEESLEVMLGVIKLVNDSLHQPNIKGLPEELFPLGSLVYQETFLVLTIKIQSQEETASFVTLLYVQTLSTLTYCCILNTSSVQSF